MKRLLLACCAALLCLAGIAFAYVYYRSSQNSPKGQSNATAGSLALGASTSNDAEAAKAQNATSSLVYDLPADAPAIVFADLAELRSSAFAKQLSALAPTSEQDPQYTAFVQNTGFDYARDLNQVAIALWPQTFPTSVVAVADGRFDAKKIETYAMKTGRAVKSHGRKIYEVPEQDSQRVIRFTFLSATRIALADGPALNELLSSTRANRTDNRILARIGPVSGATVFAVAKTQNLPQDLGIDASRSAQLTGMLKSVRNITLTGQPASENLDISAFAECDSSFHALELMTLLDGLRWMGRAALADPKTEQQIGPQWTALDALLKAASLTHDHQFIRLHVKITQEMLAAAAAATQPASKSK